MSGRTPTTSVTADADAAAPPSTRVSTERAVRRDDPTPPVGQRIEAPTARGLDHSRVPTAVVGGLLAVAAVVGIALFLAVNFGGEDEASAPDSVLPNTAAEATEATPSTDDPVATSDEPADAADVVDDAGSTPTEPSVEEPVVDPALVSIATVQTYDPDGDGVEEDDLVTNVLDGDPQTVWRTTCYSNEWMGGKRGVGVVVSLDAPAERSMSVDIAHAPSLVQFYATDAEAVPATLDGWGGPIGEAVASSGSATVVSPSPAAPARHLLVLIQQLGPDGGCSGDNPFRGSVSDIRLAG